MSTTGQDTTGQYTTEKKQPWQCQGMIDEDWNYGDRTLQEINERTEGTYGEYQEWL